jgi:hypothetical protein
MAVESQPSGVRLVMTTAAHTVELVSHGSRRLPRRRPVARQRRHTATHQVIGERFARYAFAAGGPFAIR